MSRCILSEEETQALLGAGCNQVRSYRDDIGREYVRIQYAPGLSALPIESVAGRLFPRSQRIMSKPGRIHIRLNPGSYAPTRPTR